MLENSTRGSSAHLDSKRGYAPSQVRIEHSFRLMPDSVLLPTGKILVVNGLGWGQAGGNAGETQYARTPIYESSIFDPQSSTFATLASATQKRLYHSGALLLQTGHVMTFGSEMDNYDDYWTVCTYLTQRMQRQTRLVFQTRKPHARRRSTPTWKDSHRLTCNLAATVR